MICGYILVFPCQARELEDRIVKLHKRLEDRVTYLKLPLKALHVAVKQLDKHHNRQHWDLRNRVEEYLGRTGGSRSAAQPRISDIVVPTSVHGDIDTPRDLFVPTPPSGARAAMSATAPLPVSSLSRAVAVPVADNDDVALATERCGYVVMVICCAL